jgi:hypothetical protein
MITFLTSLVPLPARLMLMAAFAVALMGFGYYKGVTHEEARCEAYKVDQQKAVDAQVAKAGQTTNELKSDALILEGVKNDEIKAINGRLSAALGELRSRPERGAVSASTAAACTGVSGAELAKGDAGFLERYSADAAILASAVKQCEGRYESARQRINAMSK